MELDDELIKSILDAKTDFVGDSGPVCDGQHEGVCLEQVPEAGFSLMSKNPLKDGYVIAVFNDERADELGPATDMGDLLDKAEFIGHISTAKALRLAASIIDGVAGSIPKTQKEMLIGLKALLGADPSGALATAAQDGPPSERINVDGRRGGLDIV